MYANTCRVLNAPVIKAKALRLNLDLDVFAVVQKGCWDVARPVLGCSDTRGCIGMEGTMDGGSGGVSSDSYNGDGFKRGNKSITLAIAFLSSSAILL